MKNTPFDIPLMHKLRNEKSHKIKSEILIAVNKTVSLTQEDESLLFLKAMVGIKPIYSNQIEKKSLKKIANKIQYNDELTAPIVDMMSDETQWVDLERETEQASYLKSGYEPQVLKKMKQGKFILDHQIDLHGLTITTARDSLSAFLRLCAKKNMRYILIIHGKGYHSENGSVLKAKVLEWLAMHQVIIAYISAPLALGGTGAVVCKLKK